ncbi:MAG: cupin [Candidatus Omnitrophica bacterium CG1_02_49_10]|nr:MAG: cupin [Candidatus Omnitrophica bacterium CG1_02_49_10]
MASVIKDLVSMMEFPKEGVLSKVLVKSQNTNYTLFCLGKGSDISEHTTTREASVTVLKGRGTFTLEGKNIKLEPGVFIYMPPDAPHSLKADEDLALLLTITGKEK